MGAWGAGLFDDDTAIEIRDAFRDLIAEGATPEAATATLERKWGTPQFDPDEEPVFWLALAATQVSTGRLLSNVRDRAIQVIDSGRDVERFFDEPQLRSKRAAQLETLRGQLLGPQKKPTRIKLVERHENSWPVGAILTYRLASGRLSLWRVVDHHIDDGGRHAVVEILSGTYAQVPSELAIALTPALRELKQQRHFRMILLPHHEQSDALRLTDRGGSLIAAAARLLRRDRSALAGDYLTIVPMARGIPDQLSDILGLT